MGSRTRVAKIGQNVRQLAQCFHTPESINTHNYELQLPILHVHVHVHVNVYSYNLCKKNTCAVRNNISLK